MSKSLTVIGIVALTLCCVCCFFSFASSSPSLKTESVETGTRLSKTDLQKVVDFILQSESAQRGEIRIDAGEVLDATGVQLAESHRSQLGAALMSRMQSTGSSSCDAPSQTVSAGSGANCNTSSSCAAPGSKVATVSRCGEYGACSLTGDLTNAKDDVLEMYSLEKASDGKQYTDFALPQFDAITVEGSPVHSKDLMGKPTLLVALAVHCSHSYDTLPILKKIQDKYEPLGIQVVGVYVNSHYEDAAISIESYDVNYPVWANQTTALGDAMDSHLVPTFLLADAQGMVKQKLVGFKTQEELEDSLAMNFPESMEEAMQAQHKGE